MKKRKQIFSILIVVMSVVLLACNKMETVICRSCSATNNDSSKYCSACGSVLSQSSPEETKKQMETITETLIDEFKEELQGHWVLKEDDYVFVLSFDFTNSTLQEGFYRSEGRTWQIKSLALENEHTLAISAYFPGYVGEETELPASGTYKISFTSTGKIEISVQYNSNDPFLCKYAGKTQASLDAMCEESNESNSNNSQTESNWDFRVDEGMSKTQVDGLWGSPIQITRYKDGSGYSCYYYDKYGNHRMVIYDNNFIVIFVLGDDIMDSASNNNNHSNTSQSSVVGKWYASYVMYTSGGMKNLDDTYYTIELFSDGTGTENFLGEVRNFKWTLQKENDGLSGNIQFGTLTPAWLYYRGSNLIIDTGSSQTFFSKG